MSKPVVFVVDGWCENCDKSFTKVFRKSKRARRSLAKLRTQHPDV